MNSRQRRKARRAAMRSLNAQGIYHRSMPQVGFDFETTPRTVSGRMSPQFVPRWHNIPIYSSPSVPEGIIIGIDTRARDRLREILPESISFDDLLAELRPTVPFTEITESERDVDWKAMRKLAKT